jgi:multidrug resistance efflux pump
MRDGIGSSDEGTSVESPAPTWEEDSSPASSTGQRHGHAVDRRVASLQLDKPELLARKTRALNPLVTVAAIAGCAAMVSAVWYFGQPQSDSLPTGPTPSAVIARDTDVVLETSGHIDVESTVQVNCRVRGIIVLLDFDEGQFVRQGDLLAQLDDTPYRADVQEAASLLALKQARLELLNNGSRPEELRGARAALQRAEHRRDFLQSDSERSGQLLSRQSVSRREHEERQSSLHEAEALVQELAETMRLVELGARQESIAAAAAEVHQAEAMLMKAQYYLDSTEIVAPVDGVVLEKIAVMGQRIGLELGPSSVCILASRDGLQAVVDIHERDLGLVEIGQKCLILSDSDPQQHLGSVRWLSPILDRKRNIREAKIQIENPQDWLLPGMNCRVRLLGSDADSLAAVSSDQSGQSDASEIKPADAPIVASSESN